MVKIQVMQDIPISQFKAKCLGLIDQVHKTWEALTQLNKGRVRIDDPPTRVERAADQMQEAPLTGEIVRTSFSCRWRMPILPTDVWPRRRKS